MTRPPNTPVYPVAAASDWKRMGRMSLPDRVRLFVRDRRYRKRTMSREGIRFDLVRRASTPSPGPQDVVLLCVCRDAERYIPSFLAHYRKLGVARFAFVDDKSGDATRALLDQPDVDLFESNVDYRATGGGLLWRDMLVEHYGRGRWYVSVDCDEYLVFPGCEARPLASFIADLQGRRLKRAMAVMLDIYPDGPLRDAPSHRPAAAMPASLYPLFDGDGYDLENGPTCLSVRGGPRQRMFGVRMRINKFPVIHMDRRSQFSGGATHGPFPLYRNFTAVQCVLLHYKFPADAVEEFRKIVSLGQHVGGSKFYKAILEHEAFGEEADLRYEASMRYGTSEDLVRHGFIQDLR
ncbi:glycosyltransferase family 2 protein [Aureimonas leprariae]|nr:glycosyltransferase family 2 protein [Aureimonas leprariae]